MGTLVCNHPLPSSGGAVLMNRAGGPGLNPEDVKWLDNKLKVFLADPETLLKDMSL